jgi:hypothetical protein
MLVFGRELGAAQLADFSNAALPGKLTQYRESIVIAGGRRKRGAHTALRVTPENGGVASVRSDVDLWPLLLKADSGTKVALRDRSSISPSTMIAVTSGAAS